MLRMSSPINSTFSPLAGLYAAEFGSGVGSGTSPSPPVVLELAPGGRDVGLPPGNTKVMFPVGMKMMVGVPVGIGNGKVMGPDGSSVTVVII
ncbi:hypothetical protein ACKVWC_011546 [Pyricularia oryzae]